MDSGPGWATTWRGWMERGDAGVQAVTSARLSLAAQPRNRLFPKTRSWFALDAPLELLSPLSVLRVLFVVAAVTWLVVGLAPAWPRADSTGIVVVSVATALVWLALLAIRSVPVRGSCLLVGYWTLAVGTLVWCGRGSGLSLAYAFFFVPAAVFAALFLGRRAAVLLQAGTAVVLCLALVPSEGVVRAVLVVAVAGLALSTASVAVLLLQRSARRFDTTDPDTGLPNGFGLARHLATLDPTAVAVVAVVVLDGIGDAREALGYQVGTELLRRAIEDLGQVLPSAAVIGRVDGDELVVALGLDPPDGHGQQSPVDPSDTIGVAPFVIDAGGALADTLVRAISAGRYLVGAIEVTLRAHVGLSAAPGAGADMAELVRRASLSARRAAESGLIALRWTGDENALTADDLALLGDLRFAGHRGELTLAYQPQIARSSGTVRSVEALLRWNSPVHGNVPPGRFIPLAERTGLVDRLTRWVMPEALDAQVRWRRSGIDVPVSVNLSPKSLPDPDLPGWILQQLADRGLPASCLTVEVTETAVADPTQAAAVLQPLHQSGIRISIDDFGTGFTSLAALPSLPLDELKIDQCFVMRSTSSPADEAIVKTIAELGHHLGLDVVAEGVETEAINELLDGIGIDLLQGYLFARPLPEAELLVLLGQAAAERLPSRHARSGASRRRRSGSKI